MITLEFDRNSSKSLYAQLYEYLRDEILTGNIKAGERLPSLRSMADMLNISITTVRIAYDQLLVEGYIVSRPQSGFYAADDAGSESYDIITKGERTPESQSNMNGLRSAYPESCDPASFDFVKWKKCMASVLNDMPELLLSEGDRQGEPALREEIAEYLFRSRGVVCTQDQVVISAGTQQLINHLARILKMMDIGLVCTEEPGYLPVRNSFRDWGFSINSIPVHDDGIEIEKLPINIRTAVYVCPQNQFPTGAVMPVGRRHQILEWAAANDSIIIEDDYNSELRYFGMPVPALQGLYKDSRVVYLGSFSSTLFPAVRISYMVLPDDMAELYRKIRNDYDQTCSKTEQLTLALFMQRGYYQSNLRRIRKLYSRKLEKTLEAIRECDACGSFISAENTVSGINIFLHINTRARVITSGTSGKSRVDELSNELMQRLTESASALGLKVKGIEQLSHDGQIYLIFYYNQIPLERIRSSVRDMIDGFRAVVSKGGLNMPSVYEVIRIREGRPVFLKEHFERLEASLASIGMEPPFSFEELGSQTELMTGENNIVNHNLKVEVDVSGYSVIYMNPTHYPAAEMYRDGVRVGLLNGERRNPNIKMMDRELRDAADAAIKEKNVYEVLLVDRNGHITEGSRSNVFFIKDGEVYTSPETQVLKGVTRLKVLEIIRELGVVIHEKQMTVSEARACDAAFISGTSPGVLPAASLDGTDYDVNDPLLRVIMQRYEELLMGYGNEE